MEIDFSELDDKYKSSPERCEELQRCLKRKIDEKNKHGITFYFTELLSSQNFLFAVDFCANFPFTRVLLSKQLLQDIICVKVDFLLLFTL